MHPLKIFEIFLGYVFQELGWQLSESRKKLWQIRLCMHNHLIENKDFLNDYFHFVLVFVNNKENIYLQCGFLLFIYMCLSKIWLPINILYLGYDFHCLRETSFLINLNQQQ